MSLKLYRDHHVDAAITEGLRQRGIDVLTCRDDGTTTWEDKDLLERATQLGRVFFSQDDDLLVIAHQWQDENRSFAGLIYGHQLVLYLKCRDHGILKRVGQSPLFLAVVQNPRKLS